MIQRIAALICLGALPALGLVSALGQVATPGPLEPPGHTSGPEVRIAAPISVKPLVIALTRVMKEEKGIRIVASTDYSSLDAIDGLAQGNANLAFLTRPLTVEIRGQYSDLDLVAIPVGMEVAAFGVANDIWEAGLHAIAQKDMRAIYERKITNWKEVGGPDEAIHFFNFAEGGGIWEILAEWLYGDNRKAPIPKVETMATSQDSRDTLEFTPGAIAPIGAAFSRTASAATPWGSFCPGSVARPIAADVASKAYPAARPMIAVSHWTAHPCHTGRNGIPDRPRRPALIQTTGALGLDAVPKPPAQAGN